MSRVRTWSLALVALAAVGLAGCSSSSSSPTTTEAPSTTSAPASTTTTAGSATGTTGASGTSLATIPVQDRSPIGVAGKQPSLVVPPGTPPTQLESVDLIVGTGPVAKKGDSVTVQYVLATYSTRRVIQSSWTSQPFTFTIGSTSEPVIPGWDEGVVGMQAGGRRELIIPPSLGYGSSVPQGASGIASNDTLVFIIDVLKVN
jgi:peptidylprolyl isomerase